MSLEFCPKCENIMIPEKLSEGEFWIKCHHCGFSRKLKKPDSKLIEKEMILHKHDIGRTFKVSKIKMSLQLISTNVSKCDYNKAQVIDMGISYSDEDNLIFLKCGKMRMVRKSWERRQVKF